MDYAILWLGKLAGNFLLVALVIALAAKCKKTRWRRVWPILLVVLIAACFVLLVISYAWLFFFFFWYTLSLAVAYIVGSVMILRYGLKGSSTEEQAARSWPRLKLAVAVALVLVINIMVIKYMDSKFMDELSRVRAEATAKLQDMMPRGVPEAQNAYPVYEQAVKALGPDKDMPEWFRDTPPDVSSREVSAFVAKHRDAVAMAYKAASLSSYYDPEVDTTKSYNIWHVPKFANYRNLAYLLYHSACSKALAGDTAGAFQDLAVIEGISRHLWNDAKFLISTMISVAVDRNRVRGLEYVLARTHATVKGLINLPVKAHLPAPEGFRKALLFEALGTLQGECEWVEKKSNWFSGLDSDIFKSRLGNILILRVFYMPNDIETQKKISELLAKPVRTYEELYEILLQSEVIISREGVILTKISPPNFKSYLGRCLVYDACQGLAELALAATAFKAAKSRYPEKIEELVPNYIDRIPTDPFDGKPLKMKPVKGGLELYSIGSHPKYQYEKLSAKPMGPVSIFLGKEAYEQFRVKVEREARLEKEKQMKKAGEKQLQQPTDAAKK